MRLGTQCSSASGRVKPLLLETRWLQVGASRVHLCGRSPFTSPEEGLAPKLCTPFLISGSGFVPGKVMLTRDEVCGGWSVSQHVLGSAVPAQVALGWRQGVWSRARLCHPAVPLGPGAANCPSCRAPGGGPWPRVLRASSWTPLRAHCPDLRSSLR